MTKSISGQKYRHGCLMAAISLATLASAQVQAQETAPAAGQAESSSDELTGDEAIIVTGFRASLDSALNIKRGSVAAVDAIVAEDIGKFPDQNLAESLQRIPGVAITREAGEGNQITVRGLGGEYTRVTVNGMETVATATVNRGRGFDFNIFASELFSSIVVHKTAEAYLDEGSLGSVVDLNTGNALGLHEGLNFIASAKAQYNDLNKDVGPRLSALVGYRDPGGEWGVSFSAAWSKYSTMEAGNNTVRWQQARFNSVDGTPCFTTDRTGGQYVPSDICDRTALAFHPRIPRYGEIEIERERLGLTGSFQWRPGDATELSLNALYAKYDEDRRERWAEVLFRGNERGIDLIDPVIDDNNTLVAGTVNNAWVRIEDYQRLSKNEFYQFSGELKHEFSDAFKVTLYGGLAKSTTDIPTEATVIFDDRDANGYSFDYSADGGRSPRLTFNSDITEPSAFQFAEFRDRPSDSYNATETARLDLEWKAAEGFTIKTGAFYRRFKYDLKGASRDSTYCAAFGCAPGAYGLQVTDDIARYFTLKDAGSLPDGTTTRFLIPDLAAATALIDLYNRPLNPSSGDIRDVSEKATGGYIQFNLEGTLLGLDYAANAGVRYVRTAQESTGINSAQSVTIKRSYEDFLPSVNVALFPADNFIVRGAIGKVMKRPGLGTLSPGGSVDGFNYRISFGNPYLQPTRATNYDLSFEWYFAPQSLISLALFVKDIESFPIGDQITSTYASTGLPLSLIIPSSPAAANPEGQPWTINTTVQGPGATLKGVELGVQLPFTFLPGPFDGFGMTGNVTYVKSPTKYTVSGAATDPNPAPPNSAFPGLVTREASGDLLGLSKWSANATLYYEKGPFSARASLAYRSDYFDSLSGNGNVFEGWRATTNLDASISYDVTEFLQLRVDGINLLDTYQDRFTDDIADRNYSYNHTGRVLQFGARVNF